MPSRMSTSCRGVLGGLRIVEFDAIGPVPFCAMMLADHGAEVVRITRPGAPPVDVDGGGKILQRGRKSIALDLKTSEGQQQALALIELSDGLMEGFRPGVMERLGLGPAACLARNVRLVYGRMTGWGQFGPLAAKAGHDINYLAVSGALHAVGPAALPMPPLNLVADYGGGALFLGFGILAGLLNANRTGRGQVIDAAMCDGVPLLLSLFHALAHNGAWRDQRETNLLDGGAPFYRCYPCHGGGFLSVGALEPQFYRELLAGLDLQAEAWPQHDRALWPAMAEAFTARFMTRSRDEWVEHFAPLDACVAPVFSMREAQIKPHLAARGVFREREGLVEPAPAPRFSGGGEASPPAATRETAEWVLARWRR